MRRWPLTLLAVFLFVWEPLRVAGELLGSISTLGMRGPVAFAELAAHASVAAIAVAGSWSLWSGAPHARALAIIALAASAAVSVQSLYWSALPQQAAPGQQLPLAALAVAHSAGWTIYLARLRHQHDLADHVARLQ